MGIFRDLVSNVANARMMEEQQKLAYNLSLGTSLLNLARNPTAKPGERAEAASLFTDLMSKHGGKQGKALQPRIQSLLTGYISSTMGGSQQPEDQAGGATPSGLTGQQQPFPGVAPGIRGIPQQEREQIAGQLGPQATPASLATGQAGLTPAARAQTQIRQQRGGFGGALRHLAGGLGTVGKEMLGVPPGQPETPWDPRAFQMTPEQQRRYDYEENLKIGQAAGLHGDALTNYALTGKPPSDFGRLTGPTDAEIQQAGEQFDRLIAPQMKQSGIDDQRMAAARVQYVAGVKLANMPPEQLYTYTDANGVPQTVVRRGGMWVDSNTGQQAALPAGVQPARIGQQRAPTATDTARSLAEAGYAAEVLKKPVSQMTDEERLKAWGWGRQKMTMDPRFAVQMGTVPRTQQNPQGDPVIDLYAEEFITRGFTLPGAMGGQGFPRQEQVAARAVEMLQTAGYSIGDLPGIREGIKANAKEFDKVVQMGGQLAIFNGTIQSNLANLRVLNAKYERSDFPFANRVWNAWTTGKGDTGAVNFAAQLHILAIEWAKAMTGLMSNANVQVTSAADAEAIMSRYLSKFQVNELFDQVIVPDLQGRENAQNREKRDLQNAIRNFGTLTPQEPTTGAATLPPPQKQPAPTPTPTPAPAPSPTPAPRQGGPGDKVIEYLKRHPLPKR